MSKPHNLKVIADKVNESHPGLGDLAAFEVVVVKCKKLLLIVSPHGCGKSKASSFIASQAPTKMLIDRLSVAGLAAIADDFNGFDGLVVVDDIAKTQTPYARINTITTLAELVYSHSVNSHLSKLHFTIDNFNGSAVVNVQPIMLKNLVTSPEWEASIQDKAVRYYHLTRPTIHNPGMPDLKIDWGEDYAKVADPDLSTAQGQALILDAGTQWGMARTREHLTDMLKAAAAIDGRKAVTKADYEIIAQLIRPCRIEQAVMDKRDFEEQRELDSGRLALLTEYYTHGPYTSDHVAEDYNLSLSQSNKLMAEHRRDWIPIDKSPTVYAPSPNFMKVLKQLRLVNLNGTGVEHEAEIPKRG